MVVTAVSRDGTREGFDLALLREVMRAAPDARLVASGGAGGLSHLRVLAAAGLHTLAGAIARTALYEGKFTIREGQSALEGPWEMLTRRIIPCLDVKDGRVVKGVKFEELRDARDPLEQ